MLAACAPAKTVTEKPTPVPAPTATTPAPTTPPPAATPAPARGEPLAEAPRNWHLLDVETDRVQGAVRGSERAMRELLAGRAPRRTVLVAVIDNGIDTAHVDLRANLWTNPREVAGNRKDDDKNGYVDERTGGTSSAGATAGTCRTTLTRCASPRAVHETADPASGSPLPTARWTRTRAKAEVRERARWNRRRASPFSGMDALTRARDAAQGAIGHDSLKRAQVTRSSDAPEGAAGEGDVPPPRRRRHHAGGARGRAQGRRVEAKYGLNPEYDPRTIVGDDYTNRTSASYGNADVMGPDAKHGTHVAGIIGAVRGNARRHRRHRAGREDHDAARRARRRRARQGRRQRDPLRRRQRRAGHQHELRQGVLAVQSRRSTRR